MLTSKDKKWIAKMLWMTLYRIIRALESHRPGVYIEEESRKEFIAAARRTDKDDNLADKLWSITFVQNQGQGGERGRQYVTAPYEWTQEQVTAAFVEEMSKQGSVLVKHIESVGESALVLK